MPASRWKDAVWDLLNIFSLRRLTARIALSASLLGLASGSGPDAAGQPRVPVTPTLAPEATVRKFKGRYVLKRAAGSFFIHLAGHRSHSSHSSHRSHSSHSSSSHYSGSHFSSSPTPPSVPVAPPEPEPAPAPPRRVVEPPPPPPKPQPLLRETFDAAEPESDRWVVGVIATPAGTFDPAATTVQVRGVLNVTPVGRKQGTHFSGYVSQRAFNLAKASIAAEVRRPAGGGATTIFAAAIDSENWIGFRIEGGELSLESHTAGHTASRKVAYDPQQQRFLRLRTSSVAPVAVWETSADGAAWNPEYVETARIKLGALQIALSAGTTRPVEAGSAAVFDNVAVEASR